MIVTDSERDGTLSGMKAAAFLPACGAGIPWLAAGGYSSEGDLRALEPLVAQGLRGVIAGRALYADRLPQTVDQGGLPR